MLGDSSAQWVPHCGRVPTPSPMLCGRLPRSAHMGWSLHLPYGPSTAPAPWRGGGLARSCVSASGTSMSGTNQPLPPLQAGVFETACRTCRRSCVPARVMSPCPCPSSCAPPTRFGTLLSACPSLREIQQSVGACPLVAIFWGVSPVLTLARLLAGGAVLVPQWWRSPGRV